MPYIVIYEISDLDGKRSKIEVKYENLRSNDGSTSFQEKSKVAGKVETPSKPFS